MVWTWNYFVLIVILSSIGLPSECFSVPKRDSDDSSVFFTPYIKSGRIFHARAAGQVKNLPNAPDIPSYAGYLTVNETTNSNLFFWFFPSAVSMSSILSNSGYYSICEFHARILELLLLFIFKEALEQPLLYLYSLRMALS